MSSSSEPDSGASQRPWQQQLYDSIWLLAGAAIVFFVLSYMVWGLVDILTIPAGGTP
jgi:hypothetical protein